MEVAEISTEIPDPSPDFQLDASALGLELAADYNNTTTTVQVHVEQLPKQTNDDPRHMPLVRK